MILFLDTVSPLPVFSVIEANKVIRSIQVLSKNSKKISDCIIPAYFTLQNQLQVNDKIEKLRKNIDIIFEDCFIYINAEFCCKCLRSFLF